MSVKVECTIEIVDVAHNSPRLMSLTSHHQANPGGPWVDFELDSILYRVKAKDLQDAITSAIGPEVRPGTGAMT